MAQVTLPDGTKYELPDAGQAYKTQQGTVGFRQGNQILEASIEGLGQKYFTPSAGKPSYDYVSAGERYNLGLRALQEAGIDYNSLSQSNIDYGQLERLGGFSRGTLSDLNLLKGTPTNVGEQINVGISPDNPHGVVVTSNTQGQLSASPSTAQALQSAGATPQQAQALSQAAQQNINPQTGIATAYTPQQLQQAGVNQPIQQTTQQGLQTTQPQQPVSSYTGPSVVDYLASLGQPSDFNSRARLAQAMGIQNYRGSAEQNTQLLSMLRSQAPQQSGGAAGQTSSGTPAVTGTGAPQETSPKGFIDSYKDIVRDLGISDIKKEFEEVQKEYDELQNELNDEIDEVNKNPWISEALRSRKISALQDKYERKSAIISARRDIYDSLYQQGIAEAKFLATGQQAENEYLTNLAMKQTEAMAKLLEFDSSAYKEVRGGLYDIKNGRWVVQPKDTSDDVDMNKLLSVPEAKELGVPYGTTRGEAASLGVIPGAPTSGIPGYREERSNRILTSIEELSGRVSNATVGIGSLLSGVPTSSALNFATDLETLKANISFNELQAMREASKTGGALGQVAVRELELLEATLGGLDQRQSPANFSKNLEKIRGSIERFNQAASTGSASVGQYTPGSIVKSDGIMYLVGPDGISITPIGSAL